MALRLGWPVKSNIEREGSVVSGLTKCVRTSFMVAGLVAAVGSGVIAGSSVAPQPQYTEAEQPQPPTCEDDACIKNERWWWFDSMECKNSPGTGSGCDVLKDGCRSYDCGLQ